ncbi:thiamine pyrophosphate-binding protein [Roseibium sp.]|uniref:thiamine pyrophosphate-binding protein n=1 Tax=Roseibium sp. TaxID=1936156 RepID=UPI003A985C44
MRTGADVIAEKLKLAGCRHAFGIPGGEVLALMDGLDRAGLRFVLVKHENAGGFMAEGGWHADGAPGVLLATLGPGVANAINVVANAWQDRVPLIFLTGCVDAVDAESYTHQVFDHQQLLRPIVKASFTARTGAIDAMMEKAIALATDGQPGPVHIDVPIKVAESACDEVPSAWRAPAPAGIAEAADLQIALDLFANAQKPLVIAGVDAVNEGAGSAITEFCQRFSVPLVTTYKAKGLMDERSELALGGAGLSPKADAILLPLLAESDCVLLLGYDPIEMRVNWRNPWPDDAPVIDVTPILRTHGMHRCRVELRGTVSSALKLFSRSRAPDARAWPGNEPETTRGQLEEAFAPEAEGWGPATVFHTLRRVLPESTTATADSGAHRILASQIWKCYAPRGMLQSSALCTMGCALPLAMGRSLVDEARAPVIAFVGDAGLEMCLGELSTLRDLQLPVIICVLVDRSLSLIELKQRAGQRRNLGVDFGETDFPAVAKAYGGHGVWIEDLKALETEAVSALGRSGFTLLACRINDRSYDGRI